MGEGAARTMRYNTLGIQITNTCNMTCAHCITDSSPSARGDLSWKQIEEAVRSAAPHIEGVCVTGGEPMLRPELTLKTITLTRDLGLISSMVTNAFWSRTQGETLRVFRQLADAGLSKMGVSFDRFHDRIVNAATLDRLLTVGAETNIRIQIQYCGDRTDAAYRTITDVAGRHGVEILSSDVVPFGRGQQIAIRRNPNIDRVPDAACGVAVRPVLTPEGDLYTCCGPARGAPADSPLRLRTSAPSDVGDALRSGASNPLLNLIHTQGPRALYDRLSPESQQRVAGRLLDESFCALCRAITDDRGAVAELESVLADQRFVLMAAAGFMQIRAEQDAATRPCATGSSAARTGHSQAV